MSVYSVFVDGIFGWRYDLYCQLKKLDVYGFKLTLNLNVLIGIEAPSRDYSIPGTNTSKFFTTVGAMANLVFAFNTGMLPEIQVGGIP